MMHEAQNTDFDSAFDQAKTALILARAYHAGAVLAARHRPEDPAVQRRLQEAVQQGRGAWKAYRKAYQTAATRGRSAQSVDGVPSVFQED